MQENEKKKYYLFKALPGGLTCSGYSLKSASSGTDGQTMALEPDVPGPVKTIRSEMIGKPSAGELWSRDPDPYKAYALIRADAEKAAREAEAAAKIHTDVLARVCAAAPVANADAARGVAPELYVELIPEYGTPGVRLSVWDLMAAAGIRDDKMPAQVRLVLSRNGISIHASAEPKEADYPGITVDGHTDEAGEIWLGQFEMPCETYPHRIAARLYAGCSRFETDEPIAIVTHEVTDDAGITYRAGKYEKNGRHMRKLVYVDPKEAGSRPWTDASEESMPEHEEDEHA